MRKSIIFLTILFIFSTGFNNVIAAGAPRWKVAYQGSKDVDYYKSIAVIDDDTIYVVSSSSKVMKTTNGGVSWTTTNLPTWTGQPRAICFPSAGVGYVAGDTKIAKTTDYGKTWTALSYVPATNITSAYATSENICYFGGSAKVYYTTDGGANFSVSPTVGTGPSSLFVTPNGTVFRAGGSGGIYKSTNGASTFSANINTKTANINSTIPSLYFSSDNIGYAVGLQTTSIINSIIKTTDGGTTWTNYILGTTSTVNTKGANAVCIPSTGAGYVVGTISNAANDIYIRKTADAGVTFSIDTIGARNIDYYGLAVTPRGDVYVAGNGSILMRKLITVTAQSNDNGMGTVSGSDTYYAGESITLTATPQSSYSFVNWTDGATVVSTNATYAFTATAANKTLTANFVANAVSVSGTKNITEFVLTPASDITISSNAAVTINESATINSLVIQPGAKVTTASGKTLTTATLTINSDETNGTGTFVNDGTSNITTATVKQHLTAGRNWYVSIPISTAYTSALSLANSVVCWDETIGDWAAPVLSTLNPMRGYISTSTTGTGTITFSGELNNGEKTLNLTRTPLVAKSGFNLVGNPYPSYLDWSAVDTTTAKIMSSIWYRTKTLPNAQLVTAYTFDTYNGKSGVSTSNGANTITNLIPPMQAFWVKVKQGETGGTLTFTNAMRHHKDDVGNKLKAPARTNSNTKLLRLEVSNGLKKDQTILYFNPDASNGFDSYDSPKMSNASNSIPELYTISNNEQLVINGMNNFIEGEEIPLGFNTGEANSFTIKALEITNFDNDLQIVLKDKVLNIQHDFKIKPEYNFSSNKMNDTNRFSIILRAPGFAAGITKNETKIGWLINRYNGNLQLQCSDEAVGNGSISIFNSTGQKLESKTITGKIVELNQNYIKGIYFVRINSNNRIITEKIIID
jgi:photosystem II stability/assembly factor-like uncharacterized protein